MYQGSPWPPRPHLGTMLLEAAMEQLSDESDFMIEYSFAEVGCHGCQAVNPAEIPQE